MEGIPYSIVIFSDNFEMPWATIGETDSKLKVNFQESLQQALLVRSAGQAPYDKLGELREESQGLKEANLLL